MSVASFIPEIWNASLLTEFRAQARAAALTNRTYEGNARVGNTVVINSAVHIEIKDYAGANRTTSPDDVDTTDQSLLIDQEKSFDFLIDDIDRRQAAGSMDVYTESAGEGLALDADGYILQTAHDAATGDNALDGGGSAPADGDEAFDVLRDLRKRLGKTHTPPSQRVAFVNSEFSHLLLGADSKLTAVDVSGDNQGLRQGTLGNLLGFRIVESENLPVTDAPQVVAFYVPAVAYVSQIMDTEAMRAEATIADRLRGLHVYGSRVIRPDQVVTWNVGTA